MSVKKKRRIVYIAILLIVLGINTPFAISGNKTEEVGGVVFKIPNYFDTRETNFENYYDIGYYPETTKAKATLGLKVIRSGIVSKTVKESKDNIINNWKESYTDLKIEEKTINGNYVLIGKPRISGCEIKFAAITNDITKKLIFAIITIDNEDETNNNYLKDFDTMINGISFKSNNSNNQNNSSKPSNNLSSSITDSLNDYKDSIDKAKTDINREVDKAANDIKNDLGAFGNIAGGYIDSYTDLYKDIIDKSADIYKDAADSYGELYKDILGKYGW